MLAKRVEKTYGGNIGIVQYLTIEIPEAHSEPSPTFTMEVLLQKYSTSASQRLQSFQITLWETMNALTVTIIRFSQFYSHRLTKQKKTGNSEA